MISGDLFLQKSLKYNINNVLLRALALEMTSPLDGWIICLYHLEILGRTNTLFEMGFMRFSKMIPCLRTQILKLTRINTLTLCVRLKNRNLLSDIYKLKFMTLFMNTRVWFVCARHIMTWSRKL